MEPENLQSVLLEAGIQIDMQTLQNPTENFMLYLITEYLKKFNFDGNEISKPTLEQLQCISCPDSATDAIKIINLFIALSCVCNEIFLKDFCLTDISSPGPKRTRRQMKILFNFLAYVRNKMVENETAFIELDNQQKNIEEIIKKKEFLIAKIGATINERENKLELKQRLQQDIDRVCLEMEKNNKKSRELEKHVKDIMVQHQDAYKKCSNLKTKAVKLHKETSELQSKIVKSPEEYSQRSKDLKKLIEMKKEERQTLNDSITRKKLQIKCNENAQELVKGLNNEFSTDTCETFKQLKETSEKLDNVFKELDLLKKDIAKWSETEINNSSDYFTNENLKGHEQLLFELKNQYIIKEKELISLKNNLEETNCNINKKKLMLEKEFKMITGVQENNVVLAKDYEKYFKNQISEELDLRKSIISTVTNNDDKN